MPELARFGLIPVQGGGASEGEAEIGPLEPGAALGVQFVRGDLSATGMGTLTYRDEDRVVAFGHPMFFAGTIDLPMTGATIYDVLPSTYWSFKLGAATGLLGVIRQDRLPAIAGLVGEKPDMVPVVAQPWPARARNASTSTASSFAIFCRRKKSGITRSARS